MNLRGGLGGEHGRYELKLTSMIDVVFLLLIFFLVTLKFREPEGKLQSDLPQDDATVVVDNMEQVQIYVERVGDEGFKIRVNKQSYLTFEAAEERLAELKRRFQRTETPHIFIIDGSQDLPFQHMISAVDTCIRAGIPNISFAPPPLSYF